MGGAISVCLPAFPSGRVAELLQPFGVSLPSTACTPWGSSSPRKGHIPMPLLNSLLPADVLISLSLLFTLQLHSCIIANFSSCTTHSSFSYFLSCGQELSIRLEYAPRSLSYPSERVSTFWMTTTYKSLSIPSTLPMNSR